MTITLTVTLYFDEDVELENLAELKKDLALVGTTETSPRRFFFDWADEITSIQLNGDPESDD